MSETEPTQLRRVIVTGATEDGGHSLVAEMYEPAEHLDKVQAYFLGHGFTVEIPEPDTHATPPTGEVFDAEIHPIYQAHADLLAATGIEDLAAHIEDLKTKAAL